MGDSSCQHPAAAGTVEAAPAGLAGDAGGQGHMVVVDLWVVGRWAAGGSATDHEGATFEWALAGFAALCDSMGLAQEGAGTTWSARVSAGQEQWSGLVSAVSSVAWGPAGAG